MTVDATHDLRTVIEALRSLLERGTADPRRPGQLRSQLVATLGPESSTRIRALLHQVVGAAEENLPANLSRIVPLTGDSLRQLSAELAAARGWSVETAQRATTVWACALGFEAVAASPWSRGTSR